MSILVIFFHLKIAHFSCDQVSRTSDVVSVGQRITLRCIGQDVHGNIKLSLKALLPVPKAKGPNGNSVSSSDPLPQQKTQNSTSNIPPVEKGVGSEVKPTSSVPSVLIRSAEECDVEEKQSAVTNLKLKNTQKPNNASTSAEDSDEKEKQSAVSNRKQKNTRKLKTTSKNAENCDEEEKKSADKKPKRKTTQKLNTASISAEDCNEEEKKSDIGNLELKTTKKLNTPSRSKGQSKPLTQNDVNNNEVEVKDPLTPSNLRIGTKVKAKVYQIRLHGLVLDLGGGLRGMYRFEVLYHFLLFETLYCG